MAEVKIKAELRGRNRSRYTVEVAAMTPAGALANLEEVRRELGVPPLSSPTQRDEAMSDMHRTHVPGNGVSLIEREIWRGDAARARARWTRAAEVIEDRERMPRAADKVELTNREWDTIRAAFATVPTTDAAGGAHPIG